MIKGEVSAHTAYEKGDFPFFYEKRGSECNMIHDFSIHLSVLLFYLQFVRCTSCSINNNKKKIDIFFIFSTIARSSFPENRGARLLISLIFLLFLKKYAISGNNFLVFSTKFLNKVIGTQISRQMSARNPHKIPQIFFTLLCKKVWRYKKKPFSA